MAVEVWTKSETETTDEGTVPAVRLQADGSETPAELHFYKRVDWYTEPNGQTRRVETSWPEGFQEYSQLIGQPYEAHCQIWEAAEDSDTPYAVELGLSETLVEWYLCPTYRAMLALVREVLPAIESSGRRGLMEAVNNHLARECDDTNDPCPICQLLQAIERGAR